MAKSFTNLTPGEKVVYQAKVSCITLVPHVLLMLFFIGFITIIPAIVRIFTTDLVITNKRIYGKTGFINTKTLDTPLNMVGAVSVSNGLFGKIFGYGTIQASSSSGSYLFKGIKAPELFNQALLQQIATFDEERIRRQAQEMANAIK